jgi:GT2 family glycosyltransferase
LIINNASTDDTEEKLKPYVTKGQIKYYNTGKNMGGAGGFNYGIRKAYEEGYEYFWLMDDDSIPDPDALSKIHEARESLNGQYGYLASYVYWKDGSACIMNEPVIAKDWIKATDLSKKGIVKIEKATFVGFFTKRDVVKKIGLPIKEFFIWSDDTNYCWRMNKYYDAYLVVDSRIEHRIVSNVNADIVTDNTDRLGRYEYAFRNRYYNYRMIGSNKYYKTYILRKFIKILKYSKDSKFKRIHVMMKGVRAGKKFNPPIEYVEEKK